MEIVGLLITVKTYSQNQNYHKVLFIRVEVLVFVVHHFMFWNYAVSVALNRINAQSLLDGFRGISLILYNNPATGLRHMHIC